jgi:hypothetical protein
MTAHPKSLLNGPVSRFHQGAVLALEPLGLPPVVPVLVDSLLAAVATDPPPPFPYTLPAHVDHPMATWITVGYFRIRE